MSFVIPASWWAGGLLLGLVLYAPWLASGAFQNLYRNRWYLDPGRDSSTFAKWFSLFASINWFNNGKWFGVHQPTPLWLVPLLAIVLAGLLLDLQFNFRYVAFLAAPYYVVAGKGIAGIEPFRLRALWLALALIHSGIGLRAVYFLPFKEDYRAAVAHVAERRRPGGCAVLLPEREWAKRAEFWHVYQRGSAPPRLVDAGAAASGGSGCERVWLVWDRTWWLNRHPAPSLAAKRALENSLTRVEQTQYFGMEVGLYEPSPPPRP
jgi:hypothetical protein